MLNIYTDLSKIPDNKTFIKDPDLLVNSIILDYNDSFIVGVLGDIEKANIQDKDIFIDRFGRPLFKQFLSMTSKILLLVAQSDLVINGVELGGNGISYLQHIKDGNIFFTDLPDAIPGTKGNLSFNGKVIMDEEYDNLFLFGGLLW